MTTNRTRILLRWAARATRLATLALLLAAAPSVAALEVHQVPGDFATLQAALDAAAPGDTVVIDGGEHLYTRISKPVTLVGRASNVPYLTVASGGPPGPGELPQEPALVIDDPGGLVTLVGVRVGGLTNATVLPGTTLALSATGAGDLRVLHSTVRALALIQGAEFAVGAGAMGVGSGMRSLSLVDSRVLGAPNLATASSYCFQDLGAAPGGLGVDTPQAPVLLDSEIVGGSSFENAGYGPDCEDITSYVPASCEELLGGTGGTALVTSGNAWVAGTALTGGRGATILWVGDSPPPGFPCDRPAGLPFSGGALVELEGRVELGASGALVEGRPWRLDWNVGDDAVLLMGPALVLPQPQRGGTPLFVDPETLSLRHIANPGAGSLQIDEVGPLDPSQLGTVMAFQVFTPGVGLSRPVLAAFQPL